MGVVLTDRRSIINEAESTTGWTGGGYGTTTTDVAEEAAAVAASLAETTGQVFYTNTTPIDLSNSCLYIWVFNNALQNTWTDGPTSLLMGDGTNQIAFHQGGSDRRVFAHSDGPVSWQSCVVDGSIANTITEVTAISGSLASMNLQSIEDFGGHFITNSKALGGGYNVAVDIMRWGNDGIRITGGTASNVGLFIEIAEADRSTANQAAHGVFRELSPISFGIQSAITFGDSGSATNSYFSDSGVAVVFEDRDIANDKYYFNIEGNSGSNNDFLLTASTIASAGPYVSIQANTGNIDVLNLDGVTFSALGNPITFSGLADSAGHTISSCAFVGCGRVAPANVTISSSSFSETTDTGNGAVYIESNSNTSQWSTLSFTMGSTGGHAIYITATGTYDIIGFTYSGYGANATANAVVYNNSGGEVTLNISGGDVPTVRNGTSANTTVSASVTINVTGLKDNTEVRVFDQGTTTVVAGTEDATTGTANNRSYGFTTDAGKDLDIRIINKTHEYLLIQYTTTSDTTQNIPVQQRFDRNYDNP